MTTVRSRSGRLLVCCWDTCQKAGHKQFQARTPAAPLDDFEAMLIRTGKVNQPMSIWLFCSERHKLLWVNSHRSNGNLPAGARGTLL